MYDREDDTEIRRRKLFGYADTFGLERDDRIALAETLLRRDITSWRDLNREQINRLLDAFEGAALIMHLLSTRA